MSIDKSSHTQGTEKRKSLSYRKRTARDQPILMEVTRRPQDLRMRPILLAVTPLPRPLTTPPVTKTYFISDPTSGMNEQ